MVILFCRSYGLILTILFPVFVQSQSVTKESFCSLYEKKQEKHDPYSRRKQFFVENKNSSSPRTQRLFSRELVSDIYMTTIIIWRHLPRFFLHAAYFIRFAHSGAIKAQRMEIFSLLWSCKRSHFLSLSLCRHND